MSLKPALLFLFLSLLCSNATIKTNKQKVLLQPGHFAKVDWYFCGTPADAYMRKKNMFGEFAMIPLWLSLEDNPLNRNPFDGCVLEALLFPLLYSGLLSLLVVAGKKKPDQVLGGRG